MPRPVPTLLYHFTHVSHLARIVRYGLVCDTQVQAGGRLRVEVGNQEIKDLRRRCQVPCGPGGVVADYVPFYFAPRSPMLYAIKCGNVPTYQGGQSGLVYLCSTIERLDELGCLWVATDRNAALAIARATSLPEDLDDLVDWPLMDEKYWNNIDEYPDRRERRMAELLVHGCLPWAGIQFIGTRDQRDLDAVEATLGSLDGYQPRRDVRPHWYF
ncbi:DUF4433 domain-containing protein [uncultured Arsenicicoccus sp.]|uniref:type II toxin-antitoxin system toxin DNA ADP-ribosyl transferase DarT n=1 Tax=uncultured Arsenicicoccus sp. TaxID=491339 RepID=UPI0025920B8D|nr:DUF4433 domain-containing protein [uncultured Arsenicicoccus sp.]